jgi:hypothetical protein
MALASWVTLSAQLAGYSGGSRLLRAGVPAQACSNGRATHLLLMHAGGNESWCGHNGLLGVPRPALLDCQIWGSRPL